MDDDDEIHIQVIPPYTPEELDFRLMEMGWSPIRLMTREEFTKEYPSTPMPD